MPNAAGRALSSERLLQCVKPSFVRSYNGLIVGLTSANWERLIQLLIGTGLLTMGRECAVAEL